MENKRTMEKGRGQEKVKRRKKEGGCGPEEKGSSKKMYGNEEWRLVVQKCEV